MSQSDDFTHTPNPLANAPASSTPLAVNPTDNITTQSSAQARLHAAMSNPDAVLRNEPITVSASTDSFSQYRGVANPYGTGIRAYEPNTQLLDDYTKSYNAVEESKAADATAADKLASTITVPAVAGYSGGGVIDANGQMQAFVQAALTAAAKGVPYVWGGTNINSGVDCSGLVYAAAKAAGIQGVQRWRAVDYGNLGSQVSATDARPGDLVYYDEPGDTDHVGIYLGNGQMVAAPQSGENVKVQAVYGTPQYRRVFNDSSYASVATPTGGATYSYNGSTISPTIRAGVSSVGNIIQRTLSPSATTRASSGTGGTNRAI